MAAYKRLEGRPGKRPWRAAKRRARRFTPPGPQDPLDFVLAFMRDDSKPDALRVSVAKAALPYLHKRGKNENDATEREAEPKSEPKSEPMSDLELARRIAHILARGNAQQEREAAANTAARNDGGREAGEALPPPEGGRVGVGGRLRHDRPPPGSLKRVEDTRDRAYALADLPLSGGGEAAAASRMQWPSPQAGKRQESPSAPVAREDERAPAVDPFDPHPGYRWI
ncbi:MAG TPA: hypothetical protein VJL90_07025 [Pseudorhodoplanes sp.]|nr:hypothetical protein [Pseudorhodoplanes sp.]